MMTLKIDAITPEHALSVLKILVKEDKKIATHVQKIITKLICDVDHAEIAGEVLATLDSIEVEDLWDRSGKTRGGYIEPCEMADEMVTEALLPFLNQAKEYKALSMKNEEKLYFMGILQGLYSFDKESGTQFREWAEDVSENVFYGLVAEWKKVSAHKSGLNDIKKFVKENCQEWFETSLFK